MSVFPTTPSQTVGPYFAIGLVSETGPLAVSPDAPEAMRIGGSVYDGDGELIADHMIEVWGPDGDGRFADTHPGAERSQLRGFRGFARSGAEDGDGAWEVVTVKPGRVPHPDGTMQAPHLDVSVYARGLQRRCVTRVYFADEADANAEDPVLASVPAERRATLLAQPDGDGRYRFDIRLQGPGETVFFAI